MTILLLWVLHAAPARAAQASADQAALRTAVEGYFDAQQRKDIDASVAYWSTTSPARPGREAYQVVFGSVSDVFTITMLSVAVQGDMGRAHVTATRVRTVARDTGPVTSTSTIENSQIWRRENGAWKLVRDGPIAEDIADDLLAMTPAAREQYFGEHHEKLDASLRSVLSNRGNTLVASHRYAEALEIFTLAREVAQVSQDVASESDLLQNIANAHYFLRDYGPAADAYRERLALARSRHDLEAEAGSSLGLATVAYARGEYSDALRACEDARAAYASLGQDTSVGRVLVTVGNVQYLQADYDTAATSYQRAVDLLMAGGDPAYADFARAGLARLYAVRGDLEAALDAYGTLLTNARSRAGLDPRARSGVATVLQSVGDLQYRLGHIDPARAAFEEARRIFDDVHDAEGAAVALDGLGLTELVAGRFDAALAAYTTARARFEIASDPAGVAHAWVGAGFSLAGARTYPDAITAYQTAIRLFDAQSHPQDSARARLGLSMAQIDSGDAPASLATAAEVRAAAATLVNDDLAWRGAVRAGQALRRLNRLDEAQQAFDAAITVVARLAADAATNPDVRSELDDSGSAYAGLAFTLAERRDAAGAAQAAERRLGHLRRLALAPFEHDIWRGESDGERQAEQAAVRAIISLRAQVHAESGARRPDTLRLERLRRDLDAATTGRTSSQAALYGRLPALAALRGLGDPDAATLAAALIAPDSRLVEYLVGDDEVLALTAAKGEEGVHWSATILPITRAAIAATLGTMTPAILRDPAAWPAAALPLVAALVQPIAPALEGASRLTVIPDGLLWRIPFESLPLDRAVDVSYATSLATLAMMRANVSTMDPADRQTTFVAPRAAADDVRDAFVNADVVEIAAPLVLSPPAPLLSRVTLSAVGAAGAPAGRWELRDCYGPPPGRARVLMLLDGSAFGLRNAGEVMDTLAWSAAAAGFSTLVAARPPAEGFDQAPALDAIETSLAHGQSFDAAWDAGMAAARAKDGTAATTGALRVIGPR